MMKLCIVPVSRPVIIRKCLPIPAYENPAGLETGVNVLDEHGLQTKEYFQVTAHHGENPDAKEHIPAGIDAPFCLKSFEQMKNKKNAWPDLFGDGDAAKKILTAVIGE